jgi:hypothetical protein
MDGWLPEQQAIPVAEFKTLTVRAGRGRFRGLSVPHSKSSLCGDFVWARRALNSPKRRLPARAVRNGLRVPEHGLVVRPSSSPFSFTSTVGGAKPKGPAMQDRCSKCNPL